MFARLALLQVVAMMIHDVEYDRLQEVAVLGRRCEINKRQSYERFQTCFV